MEIDGFPVLNLWVGWPFAPFDICQLKLSHLSGPVRPRKFPSQPWVRVSLLVETTHISALGGLGLCLKHQETLLPWVTPVRSRNHGFQWKLGFWKVSRTSPKKSPKPTRLTQKYHLSREVWTAPRPRNYENPNHTHFFGGYCLGKQSLEIELTCHENAHCHPSEFPSTWLFLQGGAP